MYELVLFILGLVIGGGLVYRFKNPDLEYLKGFVDFHRKDLTRIQKIKKRYLTKFDINIKE